MPDRPGVRVQVPRGPALATVEWSRDQLWTNHSSPEAVLGAGEEVGEGDLHRDVLHHAPPGLVDVSTHDTGVHLQ